MLFYIYGKVRYLSILNNALLNFMKCVFLTLKTMKSIVFWYVARWNRIYMQQNFGRNFCFHLQESGVLEMEGVELSELVLRVHQTERYHIKRTENNAIDFELRMAANLIRLLAEHIKRTPYGTSFPSTCLQLLCPEILNGLGWNLIFIVYTISLTNEFDFYRLEWIKSTG